MNLYSTNSQKDINDLKNTLNSGGLELSESQTNSLNSGITKELVNTISTNKSNIDKLNSTTLSKTEASSIYATKESDNTKVSLTGDTMTGALTTPTLVVTTRLNIPTSAPSNPQNGDIWIE